MAPDAGASLYMVNLDCADPRSMAAFYSALLGRAMPYCEDEYSMISNGSTSIGFGRIDGYTAAPCRWPGHIRGGAESSALVGLVDLMATVVAATGAELPAGAAEDSLDVLGVPTGQGPTSPRSSIVHHSGAGTFSFRQEPWKLVMGTGSGGFSDPRGQPCDSVVGEGQLYDLAADPGETQNLWSEYPEVVHRLYRELKGVVRGPASGLSFDVFSPTENAAAGEGVRKVADRS